MSRPFEELKSIANTWGTLTRDPNPTQNDLAIAAYHTMVDRSAVRAVWGNLDPEARSFVSWLLDQRNMLALVDDLPALLGTPPEEAAALLERSLANCRLPRLGAAVGGDDVGARRRFVRRRLFAAGCAQEVAETSSAHDPSGPTRRR